MTWARSSACGSGHCVEWLVEDDCVRMRDSKDPAVELRFTHSEWTAFVNGVRAGEFAVPEEDE